MTDIANNPQGSIMAKSALIPALIFCLLPISGCGHANKACLSPGAPRAKYVDPAFSSVLEEANRSFTYKNEPIHPKLVFEFDNWVSDWRNPMTVAVDVVSSFESNEYFLDDVIQENGLIKYPDHSYGEGYTEWQAYEHLGVINNDIHVLRTFNWGGGGTMTFIALMFIRFEAGKAYDHETGKPYDQLLMKIIRVADVCSEDKEAVTLFPDHVRIHPLSDTEEDRVIRFDPMD